MQALRSWFSRETPAEASGPARSEVWDDDVIESLRTAFVLDVVDDDEVREARRIHQEAIDYSVGKNMPRTQTEANDILIVRCPMTRTWPPSNYHKVAHWGIYDDRSFRCLAVDAHAALERMPCKALWSGSYGPSLDHFSATPPCALDHVSVGRTSLSFFEKHVVLDEVLERFNANGGAHVLYWNAITFLRVVATTLSDAPEETWQSPVWQQMKDIEYEVRAGLLAARATRLYETPRCAITNPSPLSDEQAPDRKYVLSAACIRAEWPNTINVERDAIVPCILA